MCLSNRHELLMPEYKDLSLREQALLLGVNRSSYYYKSRPDKPEMLALLRLVDEIYAEVKYALCMKN